MIAMTLMVRDEADIVGPMIKHHLDEGVDLFLVTDNGSVDGTREILEDFASAGEIELTHDPRHRKQQHEVVTRMSREAARRGAQWVLNADADEFWIAKRAGITLAEALREIDPAVGAFSVPVFDMIGDPARRGTGLQRLIYRDERPTEVMRNLGIHAHATPDVAFVPTEDVEVSQGNHFTTVQSKGNPSPDQGLEVLHFPWRSWAQFSRKVENSGRAYEAAPNLRPSANHHGMRDYRRWKDGLLLASYIGRHPSPEELSGGIGKNWFVEDRRVADRVFSPAPDVAFEPSVIDAQRELMYRLGPVEARIQHLEAECRVATDKVAYHEQHVRELDELVASLRSRIERQKDEIDAQHAEINGQRTEIGELAQARSELIRLQSSRVVRCALRLSRWRSRSSVDVPGMTRE